MSFAALHSYKYHVLQRRPPILRGQEEEEEAMEFYVELLLTALISVLLAFLIGKIAGDADDASIPADKPGAALLTEDLGPQLPAGRGVGLNPIEEKEETEKSPGDAFASGIIVSESDRAVAGAIQVEERRLDERRLERGEKVSGFDLKKENTEEKLSSEIDVPGVEEVEIGRISDDLVEEEEADMKKEVENNVELRGEDVVVTEYARAVSEEKGGSLLHGEDDWEGVEKSELEKSFRVATEFVDSDRGGDAVSKLSNEVQMQLYGLHKVATEGPCYEPQPVPLKVSARTNWHAWQRLGNMNPDAAMEQYISLLTENIPGWMTEESAEQAKGHDGNDPSVVEVSGIGREDSKPSSHCEPETERT